MTTVSIVIVSWNTASLLRECLDSIKQEMRALSSATIEIVVVDNASSDGSAAMVREEYPSVRLIENEDNVGFARANNQGFSANDSSLIWMLNPDTELESGALATMVRFMEANPEAGAAGALLHNGEGEMEQAAFPLITPWRELWRLFHLDRLYPLATYPLRRWDKKQAYQVGAVQGASLMIRREALHEVGGLDPRYFMYTEEIDFCYRLSQRGWKVFWVPYARVIHYGGQSTRQVRSESFLNLYRSKIQFVRKHYGRSNAILYKAILLAASITRVVGGLMLRRLASPKDERVILADNYSNLLRALPNL